MNTKIIPLLILPLLLTGCASIVDGGPKPVRINSNPEGAKVTIFDKSGKELLVKETPAVVILDRAYGFGGEEDYRLVFEESGYQPYETHVKSTIDGWYWGNIVFGGVLGCLVDMGTGDCCTLTPRKVTCNLISTNVPPAKPNG